MFGVLHSFPLTLTLSPSAGEREQQSAPPERFNDAKLANRLTTIFPFPFGRGERVRVRGRKRPKHGRVPRGLRCFCA